VTLPRLATHLISKANQTSTKDENMSEQSYTVTASELRQFIERIERLNEEKAAIQADIKDVFAEAKGRGYEPKAIREIIKQRKKDAAERAEEEAILDTYKSALGME
jgi:uncharacterized protein (UPF0335 family)